MAETKLMDIYKLGRELELKGDDLQAFVSEFQSQERQKRQLERQLRKDAEEEQTNTETALRQARQEEEQTLRNEEFNRQKTLQEEKIQHEQKLEESRLISEKQSLDERWENNRLKARELEIKQQEVEAKIADKAERGNSAKTPKLPAWQEKDDMDSYLSRFERFGTAQNWKRDKWSINLSALLTGKALDVYYRMPSEEVDDYNQVKEALLKNFQFTEEGFRQKVFNSKAQPAETAAQFYTRVKGYMDRWVTLAKCPSTFNDLKDLIIKNAFLSACHTTLATHLKEFIDISNKDLITKADIYLQAHGITNLSGNQTATPTSKYTPNKSVQYQGPNKSKIICAGCHKIGHLLKDCRLKTVTCHTCKQIGHKTPECPQVQKDKPGYTPTVNRPYTPYKPSSVECFVCGKIGHYAKNCPSNKPIQTAATGMQLESPETIKPVESVESSDHKCCGCHHAAMFITDIKTELPVDKIKEIQRDGKNYKVCSKDCSAPVRLFNCYNLPTSECILNDSEATMMRDSGCTGVVVHQKFVEPSDYTGENKLVLMIDGSVKTVPVARVRIDCPYYQGNIDDAMVMKTPVYDLILGNIQNARNVGDPDKTWTRRCIKCQPRKDVEIPDGKEELCMGVKTRRGEKEERLKKEELMVVDIDYKSAKQKDFSLEQQKDDTLKAIWKNMRDGKTEEKRTKSGRTWYQLKNNIMYRHFECPSKEHQNRRQVVLPITRRPECMKLAHASILGGHMGIMKTLNRITNKFYWPGIQGDITRFCRSCDICQRTIPKGRAGHVPLDEMPKIDVPFKRVAVDIVGPIYPPSSTGKRYILTMVDYATRYPEAIALKNIDTISVAEAMLEVYSRVGFPEEVLSDMGTNFTSDLMKEVSRLISVKRLTTTPYHPMCNGLCERINGVLKTILKRLASEKPTDWDRYLPAVLFAYREVPQASTGFSPFELLYGRDIRGPMSILKEVWIKEDSNADKQNIYEYVLDLRDRIEKTCELARSELEKSSRRYKRYYDRTAKSRILQENDEVLLLLPTNNNKLLLQWKGPFKVLERKGKYIYKIKMHGKDRIFHINMLKQYWRPDSLNIPTNEQIPEEEEEEILATMIVHEREEEDIDLALPGGRSESYEDIQYSPQLSEAELQQAKTLVQEFNEIFTEKPGTTMLEEHRIQLTTSEPVKQRPYPLPYSMREIVNKEVAQMLQDGIIEKTDSPYASPIVMVKKPDQTYRLCIDYRKLNRITIFDGEPMPSMVDIFSGLIQDKVFSKFDLSKGFWQIPVRACDKPKTAFVTQDGVYQFCKMPFGAINSTATFNRLMRVTYGFLDKVESFVDDLLVHNESWDQHLEYLRKVFEATRKAGLTIRPKKSQIGFDSLEFLGHTVGRGRLSPQESKIQKILETPPPKTKKLVRSFIGLIGYYRSFIPNFSMIATPLTDLTKKFLPNNITWEEEHQKAFDRLKLLITQEPILKIPDFDRKFYLQTDASDCGAGAVLLQEYEGIKYPIAFYSRKFSDQHKRYSIIEKECLAIVWSVQKFEIYLYGREFVLETDHQALTFIDQTKIKNNRVMRWSLFLQNYRFQILSIKGKDNVIADYLSRSV